ncbi:MAG: hypothetical protein JGK01_11155 [Microcoleus sp. PH2017_03_ELD_O_A]|nr:hypothetical protein [Microcoleus sp. PH2017_03_ELD_O_A]
MRSPKPAYNTIKLGVAETSEFRRQIILLSQQRRNLYQKPDRAFCIKTRSNTKQLVLTLNNYRFICHQLL